MSGLTQDADWKAWRESVDFYDYSHADDFAEDAYAAGKRAGAVQALNDAADALERPGQRTALAAPNVWKWLRRLAATIQNGERP